MLEHIMRQILMISVYIPKTGNTWLHANAVQSHIPRICLSLTGARTLMLQFSSQPTLHPSIIRVNDSLV